MDFAILVLSLDIDGTWIERARADCCHGHVHLHHVTGEVQSIGPLHNEDDVARLFDTASALVTKYAITLRDTKGKE
ncbi:hypothetical protein [Curtobacterium herbarum]|uniref:Uncharacterized protein n=1 Tax=Curtobacterium herbarum TaxID=150122 RepID=A0ABP4K696_9MICO|nr:hypothetical protein [Curtobacterium herbarum]MBM7474572.1 hypothetical protein [Curtobacterium herbarum]MCS6545952.1 hypothetical protein [Curtobacterium herbarum]